MRGKNLVYIVMNWLIVLSKFKIYYFIFQRIFFFINERLKKLYIYDLILLRMNSKIMFNGYFINKYE